MLLPPPQLWRLTRHTMRSALSGPALGGAGMVRGEMAIFSIAELQADNFAEDLELPPDVADWSEACVVGFLESGGATTTAASAASIDATTAVSAESAATAPPVIVLESDVVQSSEEGATESALL